MVGLLGRCWEVAWDLHRDEVHRAVSSGQGLSARLELVAEVFRGIVVHEMADGGFGDEIRRLFRGRARYPVTAKVELHPVSGGGQYALATLQTYLLRGDWPWQFRGFFDEPLRIVRSETPAPRPAPVPSPMVKPSPPGSWSRTPITARSTRAGAAGSGHQTAASTAGALSFASATSPDRAVR